jgi:uncharacterized protein
VSASDIRFEWDPAKNAANVRKHGLDFEEVVAAWPIEAFEYVDTRADYGETRFVRIALLGGNAVVVVYTQPDERTVRIISARKASAREWRLLFSALGR